jgi:hypothetical protein
MELTQPTIPAPPSKPEPVRAKPPKPSAEEIVRRVEEGKAKGRYLNDVMAEMGLPTTAIYPARKKVEQERLKAALAKATAKPKTPALVKPKALPPGSITAEMKTEIARRYAAGESAVAIADSMGLKRGTVGPIIYRKKLKAGTEAAA